MSMIEKLAKWRFWGFLIAGIIMLFIGVYTLSMGANYAHFTKLFLIAGVGQLVIFYSLLFYLYKGILKNAYYSRKG